MLFNELELSDLCAYYIHIYIYIYWLLDIGKLRF